MIEFVLHGARQEPVFAELVGAARAILRLNPDALLARNLGNVARNRKAALKVRLIAGIAHNARVYQLVGLPLCLDNGNVERFAKLWRGESNPWRGPHGVGQIIKERVQQLTETLNWRTRNAKPRVTEEQDLTNTHGEILARATGASLGPHPP